MIILVAAWFVFWNTKSEQLPKKSLQVDEAIWEYIGKKKDNYVKIQKKNQPLVQLQNQNEHNNTWLLIKTKVIVSLLC